MVQVLITGVSGYIAGSLAKLLVERGHQVKGTVRNLSDKEKVAHLHQELPKVELVEADLLKEGSFDDAVKGVEWVFHTASPFFIVPKEDPYKELVEPALFGTKNVLASVDKANTVKRVILTSSFAAIASFAKPEDHVFTEEDWNDTSTVEKEPYRYSKTVAEKAAWEFAKGKSWDLVVINPAAVLGPPLSARSDATSIKNLKDILDGSALARGGVAPYAFPLVDVRDVAEAHVRAAENPKAHGRYLLGSSVGVPALEYTKILIKSGKYSKYPIPTTEISPVLRVIRADHSKAEKELGMKWISVEQTLIDMADSLIQFGIVPKKE